MKKTYLDAQKYLLMILQGAERLNANKKVINDLNVFPIPDGDTGDNMFMTISSGCKAGRECGHSDNLGKMAAAISTGMLLGARGNSGVILSRIFSGISKGLSSHEEADLQDFIKAMESGVHEAYGSVMTPVEGTILTVLRESVENASGEDFEGYFSSLIKEMKISLEQTPEKLSVLKEAGVVDSGGAGMLCIAEGMEESLHGIITGDSNQDEPHQNQSPAINLDDFGPEDPFEYGYCTEFLLRLRSDKVDIDNFDESVIKDYLCSVGESVVFFRDGSIIKVHIHTFKPGEILSHVQRWGEFLTIKIENMALQHSGAEKKDESVIRMRKKYGTVAVASGKGIIEAFKEAGVDEVIEGGQTMNPSAQSFIDAFETIDAENIFVFPNNSNIIMTAGQAATLYDQANIIVIPTKNIGEGYVAAAGMDKSTSSAEELKESITETIASVKCGMVSKANKNTLKNGIIIKDGDYIGFCSGEIFCDDPIRLSTAEKLCTEIGLEEHDVAIIFSGSDVPADEAQSLCNMLQTSCPMTEIINTYGGQPVFDYIIVLC